MEFHMIDVEQTQDVDKLLEIINANAKVANFYRGEISKMKLAAKQTLQAPSFEPSVEPKPVEEIKDSTDTVSDFEEEIEYYLSQLRELTPSNIEEKIAEVLPVKKHKDFKKIVLRLKLESMKNIKDLEEMIIECLNAKELEETEMYKEEILYEKRIIELLDKALSASPEQEVVECQSEENRLIFVPTTGGNIRVLDEIDHIPEEYYEGFQELFTSIKDGTFKNVRRFTNHGTIAGICEVKGFKIRVIFSRLDQNSYAIISAFIKKNQNDKAYNEALKSRIGDYRNIADTLKRNLQNEEFLELQKQYEEELFRKLGNKNTTSKTLEKGGM